MKLQKIIDSIFRKSERSNADPDLAFLTNIFSNYDLDMSLINLGTMRLEDPSLKDEVLYTATLKKLRSESRSFSADEIRKIYSAMGDENLKKSLAKELKKKYDELDPSSKIIFYSEFRDFLDIKKPEISEAAASYSLTIRNTLVERFYSKEEQLKIAKILLEKDHLIDSFTLYAKHKESVDPNIFKKIGESLVKRGFALDDALKAFELAGLGSNKHFIEQVADAKIEEAKTARKPRELMNNYVDAIHLYTKAENKEKVSTYLKEFLDLKESGKISVSGSRLHALFYETLKFHRGNDLVNSFAMSAYQAEHPNDLRIKIHIDDITKFFNEFKEELNEDSKKRIISYIMNSYSNFFLGEKTLFLLSDLYKAIGKKDLAKMYCLAASSLK